jgi:hypothetical protein
MLGHVADAGGGDGCECGANTGEAASRSAGKPDTAGCDGGWSTAAHRFSDGTDSAAAARSTCIGARLGTAGVNAATIAETVSTPGGGREGIETFGVVPDTSWPFGLAFIRICDVARSASDAFAAAGWPVVGGIGGDDVAKPASDAFAAAGWPVLAGILVDDVAWSACSGSSKPTVLSALM